MSIEIDFRRIAPRCGSQDKAFEELCCQIAKRSIPTGAHFDRFHGLGGDGGVEATTTLSDGTEIGWQAKYVFDADRLLVQATKSLATALELRPQLTKFILCFPFNLTAPTKRP